MSAKPADSLALIPNQGSAGDPASKFLWTSRHLGALIYFQFQALALPFFSQTGLELISLIMNTQMQPQANCVIS